jgi:hypothetical protein
MKAWLRFLRAEWDRTAGWALIGAGIIAVTLGFRGVADSALVAQQLAYIASGGIGGLLACGLGVGLLVSADLHDEWRKLDRIEAALRTGIASGGGSVPPAARHASPVTPSVSAGREAGGTATLAGSRALVLGVVSSAGSALLIARGWHYAADTADYAEAVAGVGWGMTAAIAGLVAATGMTVALRAQLARRKRGLLGGLLLGAFAAERNASGPADAASAAPLADVWLAAHSRRFHRGRDCPAAPESSERVARVSLGTGVEPCGICGAQ